MVCEITTSPVPSIHLSPEGTKPQNEALRILTKQDQDILKGKNEISVVKPQKKKKTEIKPEAKNNLKEALNLYL